MLRIKNHLFIFCITILVCISITLIFASTTLVFASSIEENQQMASEIQKVVEDLEIKINECEKNKQLAHELANSARVLCLPENDEVIIKAKEIWENNDSYSTELKIELENQKGKLEGLKIFLNMTYIGDFKLTGYCSCKSCCGKSPTHPDYGITAMGTSATEGRTIAMDSRYPFGTKVYIEGLGIRTVEDRGGAIKENRIDVYVSTHQGCFAQQYNTTAKVYIIN